MLSLGIEILSARIGVKKVQKRTFQTVGLGEEAKRLFTGRSQLEDLRSSKLAETAAYNYCSLALNSLVYLRRTGHGAGLGTRGLLPIA